MWGFCKQRDLTLGSQDRAGLECTPLGGPLAQASSPYSPTGLRSCVRCTWGAGSGCFLAVNQQLEINAPGPRYPSRKACGTSDLKAENPKRGGQ